MFDRWIGIYSAGVSSTNVSLTPDGVKINGNGGIRQFLEADLKGRICTIAVLDGENNLFTAVSPILDTENIRWQISRNVKDLWFGLRFREDIEKTWDLTITALDQAIKAAKIEFGNRFTGWPVWDYGAELAKCQRYQFCLSGDFPVVSVTGTNLISVFASMPVTMRQTPVIKDFSIASIVLDGQFYEPSDFTYNAILNDKDHTHLTITLTPAVTLPRGKSGTIRLSATLEANL